VRWSCWMLDFYWMDNVLLGTITVRCGPFWIRIKNTRISSDLGHVVALSELFGKR
jgi:hypothetical protein